MSFSIMRWWVAVDLIDRILRQGARQADEVEIFFATGIAVSAELKRRNVNIATRSEECGLGIRTIDKGRIGSSTTHNPKRWRECLDAAIASGRLATPHRWEGLPGPAHPGSDLLCFDPSLSVDPPTVYGLLERMVEGSGEHKAEVTSGSATLSSITETIANSNGVHYNNRITGVSISLETIHEQSTGSEFAQSCYFDVNPYAVGERSGFLASHSAGGINIPSGAYDILLSPIAYAELLGAAFIPALSGRNVHAGRSRLANHLGEPVADEQISMYDDPLRKKGLGSTFWDAEGTPTRRVDFVRGGVLESFAYDLRTAYRYGKESTANAIRGGSTGGTAIGHHNFIVDGPRTDVADERAVYVHGVIGAHTANPMSGDFSVEISNAFMMEGGEFGTPIRSAMLAGNVFTMHKEIGGLSREVRQIGSLVLPSIRLPKQQLIGK
jgi:PmbA protein